MSAQTPEDTPKPANDPAKTGYFGLDSVWRNRWSIISGNMTKEGENQYRADASIRDELADCKRCEEWRDYCFKYSPTVIFMQKNLKALNGELNGDNVQCRRCPAIKKEDGRMERQTGGFSPDHGILLCANEVSGKKQLEDTLAHEMVHAWDHLRWKVDWADLRHAACSEIRASTLSGECRWTKEFFTRNNWTVTQQFQNCVRTRAVLSVMRRPSCKDDVHAVKVVNEVWDSCFNDTRPFDGVYR